MECTQTRTERLAIRALLLTLSVLAIGSLAWAVRPALRDSDDLMRRAEEVALVLDRQDPYVDPDMSYPPSAPPVFVALVAPFEGETLRAAWLVLNLATLAVFGGAVVAFWGERWPTWLRAAVILAIVATKPVRGGIGLGQFHLIPTTLTLLAFLAIRSRRPVLAGLAIGVAMTKPTMVLPFLGLLAIRRQWTTLAVAAAFQATAWLGTSAWLGRSPILLGREWLDVAKLQDAAGLIDLPSLMNRHAPGLLGSTTTLTLAILGLGFATMVALRDRSDRGLVALGGFVAAIFAYHRPYDMVLLILPLGYLIGFARERPEPIARGLAVLFALALIWPNHPSAMGRLELWYEPVFGVLAYGTLAVVLASLARERPEPSTASQDAGSTAPRVSAQLASASS